MNNANDLLRNDMKRHKAPVILPDEKQIRNLYLIEFTAKTKKLEDFKTVYGEKATAIHLKLAEKTFGETETDNVYGVFMDENLQMVFSFNREFADYDREAKKIIFRDMDNVLLGKVKDEVKKKDSSDLKDKNEHLKKMMEKKEDFSFPRSTRSRCTGGRISYSLPEGTKK